MSITTSVATSVAAESLPVALAKTVPPTGVGAAAVLGYAVSDLILWATLAYIILGSAHLVWKIYKDVKQGANYDDNT